MLKIGLFGGTFDPPHNAHIAVAKKALELFSLDEIIFIPAGDPPHKRNREKTNRHIRLKLTELAVSSVPNFSVSSYETELNCPSYSLNTVKHFKSLYSFCEFYFIIGGDSLKDLPTWWHYRELIELTSFIVFARPDAPKNDILSLFCGDEKPPRIFYSDSLCMDISSSAIREKIKNGEDVSSLLAPEVLSFIKKEKLYTN